MRFLFCSLSGISSNSVYDYDITANNMTSNSAGDILDKLKQELGEDADKFSIALSAGTLTLTLNDATASDKDNILASAASALQNVLPESTTISIANDTGVITAIKTDSEARTSGAVNATDYWAAYIADSCTLQSAPPPPPPPAMSGESKDMLKKIFELLASILRYLNADTVKNTTTSTTEDETLVYSAEEIATESTGTKTTLATAVTATTETEVA